MDRLVKGFAFDGQVRLVGIEATDLVQTALDIHKLSPVGVAALGKLLTAGAEDKKNTISGLEELAKLGVVPAPTVFTPFVIKQLDIPFVLSLD